jgi:RND family efflux transporter MFP subunit
MKKGLAILGAVALLSACGEAHGPEAAKANAVTTQGVAVQIEEISLHIPVEGTVVAQNRAEITTRMMARVTVLAVDVGSTVRKGDLLIRLGTDDIATNRSKAEAGVMMAQAARDEGARHADRMDTLLIQDVVPQVQRDQAHLMLTQAEAQLALAQATLKEVETAESYASIRAPFDGEVVSRTIDVGDVAAPGMPLLAVEETGVREARLFVPVEASRKLNQGDSLRVSALGGLTTEAPVRAVASAADPMSKTVEVRVTLPEDWPTGVSVTALVPGGVARAITIPSEAVVRRGQLTGVRIVTPHGVTLRWIRLGRSVAGGDRVEVLTGLTAGDEIVL